MLREVTVGAGYSPFDTLQEATEDTPKLTPLIVGVPPASVCAPSDVTLDAGLSHAKKFPAAQPANLTERSVDPCDTPAPIKQTGQQDFVTVEIPRYAEVWTAFGSGGRHLAVPVAQSRALSTRRSRPLARASAISVSEVWGR